MRILSLTFLLLLSACERQPALPATSAHPTIVSLNPCADAILSDVTAPGQLLAISHFSHDPGSSSMERTDAKRYRATGGTVEEVLALAPDVVVADTFLPPSSRAAYEKLGIRVETIGIASDIAGARAQVRDLARLAGDRAAGEALVRRIDAAWNSARSAGAPLPTLMWQEGGIVPGPDSLIAAAMAQSGFALHSAARGLGQGAYLPLERVLADPPALILAASDERMLAHPALEKVSSVRYAPFDPSLLFCAGPSLIRTMEWLNEIRAGIE